MPILEKTTAKIKISTNDDELTATGEVLKFDGFLKIYMKEMMMMKMKAVYRRVKAGFRHLTVNQQLDFEQMTATERFTRHAGKVYRSFTGKKTRRTWHRKAKYLCAYHQHNCKKKLCRKER